MVCKRFIGVIKSIIVDLMNKEDGAKAAAKAKEVPIEVKKEL